MTFDSVGIVGGGAWGTALAQTLRLAGRDVVLWAREAEVVGRDQRQPRQHGVPARRGAGPGPARHGRACRHRRAGRGADGGAGAARAQRRGRAFQAPRQHGKPVVICAKGLEQATGKLLGQVLAETLPQATQAVLSGPSFAADVARGLPAALTLATADEALGQALATALAYRHLRIYWASDVVGVQLGGAVKNVLAIAAGIVEGRGLGASAHAALVTRGFAELRRFGAALGARPETLMGLSGLGDLLLTCGSPQSRNMSLGRALGQGQSLEAVLGSRRSVAEGVYTAAAVARVAADKAIDMPISQAVARHRRRPPHRRRRHRGPAVAAAQGGGLALRLGADRWLGAMRIPGLQHEALVQRIPRRRKAHRGRRRVVADVVADQRARDAELYVGVQVLVVGHVDL